MIRRHRSAKPGALRSFVYEFNCTEVDDADVDDLHEMIEAAVEVTFRTFSRAVAGLAEFADHMGYDVGRARTGRLRLANDWHVRYFRSKYKGKRVYFMVHSAIEYVFLARETSDGQIPAGD